MVMDVHRACTSERGPDVTPFLLGTGFLGALSRCWSRFTNARVRLEEGAQTTVSFVAIREERIKDFAGESTGGTDVFHGDLYASARVIGGVT